MNNWFTRLFRRKPKPEPLVLEDEASVKELGGKIGEAERRPRLEELEGISVERRKAGGDIIARQGGQKRNRTHIYRQPFGYPIRLCDWVAVDVETIERIGEAQGLFGPAALLALEAALDWAESVKGAVICKHCRALAQGKRGPIMGAPGGPK